MVAGVSGPCRPLVRVASKNAILFEIQADPLDDAHRPDWQQSCTPLAREPAARPEGVSTCEFESTIDGSSLPASLSEWPASAPPRLCGRAAGLTLRPSPRPSCPVSTARLRKSSQPCCLASRGLRERICRGSNPKPFRLSPRQIAGARPHGSGRRPGTLERGNSRAASLRAGIRLDAGSAEDPAEDRAQAA